MFQPLKGLPQGIKLIHFSSKGQQNTSSDVKFHIVSSVVLKHVSDKAC